MFFFFFGGMNEIFPPCIVWTLAVTQQTQVIPWIFSHVIKFGIILEQSCCAWVIRLTNQGADFSGQARSPLELFRLVCVASWLCWLASYNTSWTSTPPDQSQRFGSPKIRKMTEKVIEGHYDYEKKILQLHSNSIDCNMARVT